jgi:hypothetical protein
MEVVPYRSQPIAPPVPPPAGPKPESLLLTGGVVLICLGGVCALLAFTIPLGALVNGAGRRGSPVPSMQVLAVQVMPPTLLSGAMAAGLIWTGIGSIRLRRWSRPVVLCVAGVILFLGAVSLVQLAARLAYAPFDPTAALVPASSARAWNARQPAGRSSPAAASASALAAQEQMTQVVGVAVLVLFGVVLPLAFFAIYRRPSVAIALDEADPRVVWTDRAPLPVLGLAMALAWAGVVLALGVPAAIARAIPGDASATLGALVLVVVAAGFIGAAALVYRQSEWGIWLAVLLIALVGAGIMLAMHAEEFGLLTPAPRGGGWRPTAPPQSEMLIQATGVNGMLGVLVLTLPCVMYVLYARRVMRRG